MEKTSKDIVGKQDGRTDDFINLYTEVDKKKTIVLLQEIDLLMLAYEAISRSYTHDEKNYRA